MRRGYALAFLLVMIMACAGAALGLRMAINSNLPRVVARPAWTPATTPLWPGNPTPMPTSGMDGLGNPPASPTPMAVVTPALPTRPTVAWPPTPTATPTTLADATATAIARQTPTPTPSATPDTTYTFVMHSAVRHTPAGGDCPGDSIRGTVYDRGGNPLPGVRLWLVDEYGNEAFAESKREQVDLGKYDFPIFGPPRNFYLTVLNAAGHPDSPRIEIVHKRPPNEEYNCHFVDWRQIR